MIGKYVPVNGMFADAYPAGSYVSPCSTVAVQSFVCQAAHNTTRHPALFLLQVNDGSAHLICQSGKVHPGAALQDIGCLLTLDFTLGMRIKGTLSRHARHSSLL